MPELMGLSLLVGLLALVATAAVARGWLRAEEKPSQPICKYTGPGGGDSGDFAPGRRVVRGACRVTDLSFPIVRWTYWCGFRVACASGDKTFWNLGAAPLCGR